MLKPHQKVLLTITLFVLLYWALVFRKWTSEDDVQQLLIPYIAFAFGVGAVLSTFEWKRPNRSVFFASFCIPLLATLLSLFLHVLISEAKAGAGPDINISTNAVLLAVGFIALLVGAFHGVVSLAGFHFSLWLRNEAANLLSASDGSTLQLTESHLKVITAAFGFLTAVIGAVFGK